MRFYVIQTMMGIIGSVCFAVLFGILNRKTLFWIALGSGAGWIVYLMCAAGGYGMFGRFCVSSLFVAVLSEVLARILKTPVSLLLVPMLIPEIPGGDLYYTMYNLVQRNYADFGRFSNQVLIEAGAMALGIIIGSYMAKIIGNIAVKVERRRMVTGNTLSFFQNL